MPNAAINWFEIPVEDFDRAKKFYSAALGYEMPEDAQGKTKVAFFSPERKSPDVAMNGCLILYAGEKPSAVGTTVYLNVEGQMEAVLGRLKGLGAEILMEKSAIGQPEDGFIAMFKDSEGNRVGLHSYS